LKTKGSRLDYKLQIWISKDINKIISRIALRQGRTISELVREGIAKVICEYSNLRNKNDLDKK
jgi:hypothetical protein